MSKPTWYPEQDNTEAILDFILWFSRLEYTLKTAPEFCNGNKAHWDKFQNHLHKNHKIPVTLATAVDYLRNNPPQNQISATSWHPISNKQNDWAFLISALITVRNNLFHGGKHQSGQILTPIRDRELVNFCLEIMKVIVALLPEMLSKTFDN